MKEQRGGILLDDVRLRVEASRRSWNLKDVARAAGMSAPQLSCYRRGHRPVTRRAIERLERALDLAPGSLVVYAVAATTPSAAVSNTASGNAGSEIKASE